MRRDWLLTALSVVALIVIALAVGKTLEFNAPPVELTDAGPNPS